jgi:predicted secreted protein
MTTAHQAPHLGGDLAGRRWVAIGLLMAALSTQDVLAQPAMPVPSNVVQLSAQGMLEVPQDWLTVNLVVNKEGPDAAQVQTQLKSAVDTSLGMARAAAAEPQLRVRSGRFGVYPRYDKSGKVSGWRGQAELTLEGRDFTRIAQVAAQMQPLVVSNMAFSLSQEAQQALDSEVQGLAIERFRRRAGEVAKAFGFSSFEVREVSISSADAGEDRLFRGQAMAMEASVSNRDPEPVPVEPGRSRLTVNVSGSVQLK